VTQKTKKKPASSEVTGWLLLTAIAIVVFAVPLPERIVESFYSRGIYRGWQGGLTSISNLAPFALLDLFILGLVVLIVWRSARLVIVAREAGVLAALWEGVRRSLRAVAVLGLLFQMMWGLNYRRAPLEQSKAPAARASIDELRAVIADADALGTRLRRPSADDIPSFDDVTLYLRDPLNQALAKLNRTPLETAGLPKYSLILTPFFTWAGVDGMVDPFALETIVHPDLLPFERPFAVAHEWAHLAGTADEAEASAVAWLACMNGRSELAYSASIYLIVEAGSALPRPVWQDVSRRLDAGIRADLDALAQRESRQRPRVQQTASRVYDEYLRANHVDDGVASYSRALSLILSPSFREALSAYRVDRDRRP
jgi:hypothetical protein